MHKAEYIRAAKQQPTAKKCEYTTISQTCEIVNLGASSVRKLADASGTVRHFGRAYRIKLPDFLAYLEEQGQ